MHFDSGWTVNSDGLSSSFDDDDDDDDDDAEYEASIPEVAAMTVPVSPSFAIRGELGGGFGGVNILCCVSILSIQFGGIIPHPDQYFWSRSTKNKYVSVDTVIDQGGIVATGTTMATTKTAMICVSDISAEATT